MSALHLSPLTALFLVAALGYLGGRVQVRGVSLGVAAVLFAGLLVSAVVPGVELPELPRLSYASVFPIATIGKIVLAQLIVSLLSSP